jgi:hypothetical protein
VNQAWHRTVESRWPWVSWTAFVPPKTYEGGPESAYSWQLIRNLP